MNESPSPFSFLKEPFYYLLIAVPIAAAFEWMHVGAIYVFVASAIAIIPLAGLMGRSTESLAETMGPGIGGLLNATFGNAAELIIALFALYGGQIELVKASITGSIMGNILLVLGLAILIGGVRYKRQTFNRTAASLGATLLALAAVGLLIPTIFFFLFQKHAAAGESVRSLSFEISIVLIGMYLLSLLFSLHTHQHLFAGPEGDPSADEHPPEWSRKTSFIVLLIATAGVAWMSEMLVGSVEHVAETFGNPIFVGVIIVATVGNAAEHSTAVLVAAKNKMDLAITIAVGSSMQIALFVAPVLFFAGMLMGQTEMDLHFSEIEIVAIVLSIGICSLVCQDGESHWMEGALLLAVYVILGFAFFHHPWPPR